jgi:hypothetical protein
MYRIPPPEELVFAPGYCANYPLFKLSIFGHVWSPMIVLTLSSKLFISLLGSL